MFKCSGCLCNKEEHEFSILVIEQWGHGIKKYCRECRRPRNYVPDVFFDGKPEINLADGPDGKPRTFSCKSEKARYLKSRGLQEAGDKVHGSFESFSQTPKKLDSKEEVRKALQKVKQMGAWNRRQEYLKLMKENERRTC